MQKVFRNLMNVFVAITMAAFIVSAIPSSVLASTLKTDSSVVHILDSQKDGDAHQKDGQCDDGCCISHCFCAGYAIPAGHTFISFPVINAHVLIFTDQKTDGSSTSPQLRPPRNLA